MLIKEKPEIASKDLTPEKIGEFNVGTERIYGIFLLMTMKYKSLEMSSMEDTDRIIDGLWRYGSLIEQSFIFNSIDPEFYNQKAIEFFNYTKDYAIMDKKFPDLSFDRLFQDVIENDAIKQLFVL